MYLCRAPDSPIHVASIGMYKINDLAFFLCRRKVYDILMKNGVEVPRHMVVNRGEDSDHTDGEYCTSSTM